MISWELANLSPNKVTLEVPAAEHPSCAQLEARAGELPLHFKKNMLYFTSSSFQRAQQNWYQGRRGQHTGSPPV